MAAYWFVFGLIALFAPQLMSLFQTNIGTSVRTAFSDHVWTHDGVDIIAFCIILVALASEPPSPRMLRAAALAALLPVIAIGHAILATPYWSPLFLVPGVGCLGFAIWGFMLARQPVLAAA
jgi:hypothetical protein